MISEDEFEGSMETVHLINNNSGQLTEFDLITPLRMNRIIFHISATLLAHSSLALLG